MPSYTVNRVSRVTPQSPTTRHLTKRTLGRFDVYSGSDVTKTGDLTAPPDRRPLVLLIPWMTAKRRHIGKFCQLYMDMDMDVLVMRLTPWHVMRPQRLARAVRELLDLLQKKDGFQVNRPLIIHGFSVAVMVWALILMEMDQSGGGCDNVANTINASELCLTTAGNCEDKAEDRSSADASRTQNDTRLAVSTGERRPVTARDCPADHPFQQRLLGVVLDSPIQFDSLLPGLTSSISRRPCIRRLLRGLLAGYFWLFSRSVGGPLSRMQEAFLTVRPPCPVLMFYSTLDEIIPSALLDAVAEKWREQGWELYVRKWDDTPHVAHFRFHREEYEEELKLFLERIGLGKEGKDPGAMNGSGLDVPKS